MTALECAVPAAVVAVTLLSLFFPAEWTRDGVVAAQNPVERTGPTWWDEHYSVTVKIAGRSPVVVRVNRNDYAVLRIGTCVRVYRRRHHVPGRGGYHTSLDVLHGGIPARSILK